MSTLRVDNIKGRTGTTVNIPDSNNLSVSGSLSVSGVTTFTSTGELNLQGVNINSGTRGDVLAYDSNGKITQLTLGSAGTNIQRATKIEDNVRNVVTENLSLTGNKKVGYAQIPTSLSNDVSFDIDNSVTVTVDDGAVLVI